MTDFKMLVDALPTGTPFAITVAVIGVFWQIVYAFIRDRANDKEAKRKNDLERTKFEQKFEYQKKLENLNFEYERRRWREQLAVQLVIKHLDARLNDYPLIWSEVKACAKHRQGTNSLTPELARQTATSIESWRYSRGGLLAEETTRDAAIAFQSAMWQYDGTSGAFERIRKARQLLRATLRADMGLGQDFLGENIYDAAEKRNRIKGELDELKMSLGIHDERGVAQR